MPKIGTVKLAKEAKMELPPEGEIPQQFSGESKSAPYPGKYGFQLPQNLDDVFDVIAAAKVKDEEVERINAVFDEGHPLVILAAPAGEEHNIGDALNIRISNVERARDKDKTLFVSDMFYLLKEGLGHDEGAIRKELAQAKAKKTNANINWANMLASHAGETFGARVEWSASCNPKTKRYVEVDGRSVEDPDGEMGCGHRVYQKNIPKVEGRYQERFECPGCQVASLRAFPQLAGFHRWAPEVAGEGEAS